MDRCFVQSLGLIISLQTYSEGPYVNDYAKSQSKAGVILVTTLSEKIDLFVTRLVNDDMK